MVTAFMQSIPMQTGSAGRRSGFQRFDYAPAASLNNATAVSQSGGFQVSLPLNAGWQGLGMPAYGPVAANQQTTLYGDGRIREADGGQYNFARPGIFDLLKDQNIEVRGNFDTAPDTDRMIFNEAGLTVGDRAVNIRADGTVSVGSANPGSNDLFTPIGDVQNQDLGNGASLTKQGNTVTVVTPEYTMTFNTNQQAAGKQFINLQIQTGANGVNQDQQLPTGVLGETFDADNYSRSYVGIGMDGGDSYQQSSLPGKMFTWDPNNGQVGYVQMLYGNLLGQAPGDGDLHQVSQTITQEGLSAGLKQIIDSEAFASRQYSNTQKAGLLYQAVFQKSPDPSVVSHYVDELNQGQSLDAVVDEMLQTPEYYAAYNGGQALSNMSNKDAIQTLYDQFGDIRKKTGKGNNLPWVFDRCLHRSNLEAVTQSDQFDARTKAAAKRVLDNSNLFRKLDAAEGRHAPDDKIGTEDFKAILDDPNINTY